MSEETKFNYITDRIKKNSKSLAFFNNLFSEKAEGTRIKVVSGFVKEFGFYPSEAEIVLEFKTIDGKRGVHLQIQRRKD